MVCPVLLYSHPMALESLLSVALSSIGMQKFYHPLLAVNPNGLLFDCKVGAFSAVILILILSKWALFR